MQSSFIHPIKQAFPLKRDRANTDVDEQGPKLKQQTRQEEVNSTLHSGGSKSPVADLNGTISCNNGKASQPPIQVLTQRRVCRSRRQSAGIYWRPTPFQARCHADTAAILFVADTLIMVIIWVRRCLRVSQGQHPTSQMTYIPEVFCPQQGSTGSWEAQAMCHLWPIPGRSSLEIQSLLNHVKTQAREARCQWQMRIS